MMERGIFTECLEPGCLDFQTLDEEELALNEEVTTVQQGLTIVQQGSFLLPQLPAFLQQPLDRRRADREIRCAGIVLVAMFHVVIISFVLLLSVFGL
jgi:hypothetical protein